MKKSPPKIAIIGLGNMGKSIFDGLVKSGNFDEEDFLLSTDEKNNAAVVEASDVVILAVKPKDFPDVLHRIRNSLSDNKILISVAAGVDIEEIKGYLGKNIPIVRVMPNIFASVCESMSCWVKSDEVLPHHEEAVKLILKSIGDEILLEDEKLFGVVTVVSGSGPAYFLYLGELLLKFSKDSGLKPDVAEKLVRQTIFGTSKNLSESKESFNSLRNSITSRGGVTEEVFKSLHSKNFDKIFLEALIAGRFKASLGDSKK